MEPRPSNNKAEGAASTAILLHPWRFTTLQDLIALMDDRQDVVTHHHQLSTDKLTELFDWNHPGELCRFHDPRLPSRQNWYYVAYGDLSAGPPIAPLGGWTSLFGPGTVRREALIVKAGLAGPGFTPYMTKLDLASAMVEHVWGRGVARPSQGVRPLSLDRKTPSPSTILGLLPSSSNNRQQHLQQARQFPSSSSSSSSSASLNGTKLTTSKSVPSFLNNISAGKNAATTTLPPPAPPRPPNRQDRQLAMQRMRANVIRLVESSSESEEGEEESGSASDEGGGANNLGEGGQSRRCGSVTSIGAELLSNPHQQQAQQQRQQAPPQPATLRTSKSWSGLSLMASAWSGPALPLTAIPTASTEEAASSSSPALTPDRPVRLSTSDSSLENMTGSREGGGQCKTPDSKQNQYKAYDHSNYQQQSQQQQQQGTAVWPDLSGAWSTTTSPATAFGGNCSSSNSSTTGGTISASSSSGALSKDVLDELTGSLTKVVLGPSMSLGLGGAVDEVWGPPPPILCPSDSFSELDGSSTRRRRRRTRRGRRGQGRRKRAAESRNALHQLGLAGTHLGGDFEHYDIFDEDESIGLGAFIASTEQQQQPHHHPHMLGGGGGQVQQQRFLHVQQHQQAGLESHMLMNSKIQASYTAATQAEGQYYVRPSDILAACSSSLSLGGPSAPPPAVMNHIYQSILQQQQVRQAQAHQQQQRLMVQTSISPLPRTTTSTTTADPVAAASLVRSSSSQLLGHLHQQQQQLLQRQQQQQHYPPHHHQSQPQQQQAAPLPPPPHLHPPPRGLSMAVGMGGPEHHHHPHHLGVGGNLLWTSSQSSNRAATSFGEAQYLS